MGERRERILAIVPAILVVRHPAHWGRRRTPALESAIANATRLRSGHGKDRQVANTEHGIELMVAGNLWN
jgi:hypothetical protein